MPTLDPSRQPETATYAQQEAEEVASQAAGLPPALPPDVLGAVSDPGSSAAVNTGLETAFTPRPYRVGLTDHPDLCPDSETLLVFRETDSFFAGSDYELKDSEGEVVIRVLAHRISLHDTKDIESADGDKLFILKNKLMSLQRTFEGESNDGKKLFEIGHAAGGGMECTFANLALAKDQNAVGAQWAVKIALRGNFHDGMGDLVFDHAGEKTVVAQVRHSLVEGQAIVKDSQAYFVKVAAGVDLALIGTICLCFDQLREGKGSR